MNSSTSFLNDTKIETVNAKFSTSILNETLIKLALLQRSKHENNPRYGDVDPTSSTTDKFTTDLSNLRRSLHKVISELREYRNFSDFSGVSIAINESNFLTEYSSNKKRFEELREAIKELEKDIANFRTPTDTEDETTLKCAIENRFIKTWEKARRDQNDHFNRMLVDSLQNKVNCYAKNIELENRCMVEIETYSLNEMDMHKAESLRWSEKFDVDLNRTEIDIQIATSDLEAMKLNYEKMVEAIRFRVQEMIDFVALKEERATQKDSDLMKLIDEHREHLFAKC